MRFRRRHGAGQYGANGQIHRCKVAVGLDPQAWSARHFLAVDCIVQGESQGAAQTGACHFQNIAGTDFAGCRLQIHTGAPLQVQDIAVPVDQRTRRSKMLEERLLGDIPQGQFGRGRHSFRSDGTDLFQ